MRWLAGRPRWLLLGAFVLLLGCVALGIVLRVPYFALAGLLVFFLYFATLMAFVRRRENPGPQPGADRRRKSRISSGFCDSVRLGPRGRAPSGRWTQTLWGVSNDRSAGSDAPTQKQAWLTQDGSAREGHCRQRRARAVGADLCAACRRRRNNSHYRLHLQRRSADLDCADGSDDRDLRRARRSGRHHLFRRSGGLGGEATATLPVSPGQVIEILVGGQAQGMSGGFNGGGNSPDASTTAGSGGGGGSDVRIGACAASSSCGLSDRVIVAGGGGGAGAEDECGSPARGYGSPGLGGGLSGSAGGATINGAPSGGAAHRPPEGTAAPAPTGAATTGNSGLVAMAALPASRQGVAAAATGAAVAAAATMI